MLEITLERSDGKYADPNWFYVEATKESLIRYAEEVRSLLPDEDLSLPEALRSKAEFNREHPNADVLAENAQANEELADALSFFLEEKPRVERLISECWDRAPEIDMFSEERPPGYRHHIRRINRLKATKHEWQTEALTRIAKWHHHLWT